jgi:hypothetical protein
MSQPETVGICVRVRRTRVEYAFVDVLVTDEIIDPKHGLNVEAFQARALASGAEPDVEWYSEETTMECHPIQRPREPGERIYYHPGHPARDQPAG